MRYAQKRALLQQGYTIYLWDVLTHDYNPNYTPDKMLRIVQRFTRNGSIIVFHDSLKSRDRMLIALPHVIQWLQAQGYQLQTLPNP
jgi:peptidoglycan/xylan/chitin deacetylase (PgdA/CDA1 family)